MRIEASRVAPGVPPAEALRWWSDFREGHADHAFVPGQRRRILDRGRGWVTMEDVVELRGLRLFRELTTAEVAGDEVRFEGENTFSRFRGAYAFEPAPEGTRVTLRADVDLRAGLRPFTRLGGGALARAVLRRDLRRHVEQMARDRGAPSGRPSAGARPERPSP